VGVRFRLSVVLLVALAAVPGSYLSAASADSFDTACRVGSVSFTVNGTPMSLMSVRRGDHVVVTFEVPDGCTNRMTFASFVAPTPTFDGSRLSQQAIFSRQTGVFGAGWHQMAVDVFPFPGSSIPDCDAVPRPVPLVSKRRDNHAVVTFAARVPSIDQSGSSEPPCDGGHSSHGKPCAGCVGHADDKNPPGQFPNDPNAGYECDRNQGIGQGNPAHSPCEDFQVDLSYRPQPGDAGSLHAHEAGLIAAVFCARAEAVCYTTDQTGTAAVHGV
jgi:hypothetical protein